ncbi:MAG: tRNA glutamyl-Q(34) synthetase GluQRS [Gammaproteobacteria bacterium]|nr:tRNA glutamyl-Q(34) synthetase GluQRS [Gammaproteobacteria bacterium]
MSPQVPLRGRFAPSPTGALHAGSLLTATASYLNIRQAGGEWLLRIEDIDSPRTVKGADREILTALEAFGFEWQGEVTYQSRRHALYLDALQTLQQKNQLYPCRCSRKTLKLRRQQHASPLLQENPYPGYCRQQPLTSLQVKDAALRLRCGDVSIDFADLIQGSHRHRLQEQYGDFILRRRDGYYAYQLVVVVDDLEQGITEVVRGADLLPTTAAQIYLRHQLMPQQPPPHFAHLPLLTNQLGEKLSKMSRADALNPACAVPTLWQILQILGQQPPVELLDGDLNALWRWGVANWQLRKIPQTRQLIYDSFQVNDLCRMPLMIH